MIDRPLPVRPSPARCLNYFLKVVSSGSPSPQVLDFLAFAVSRLSPFYELAGRSPANFPEPPELEPLHFSVSSSASDQ